MTIASDNLTAPSPEKLPPEVVAFTRCLIKTFCMFVDTWPAASVPVIEGMLKSLARAIIENADAFDDAAKAQLRTYVDSTAFNILNALDNEDDE